MKVTASETYKNLLAMLLGFWLIGEAFELLWLRYGLLAVGFLAVLFPIIAQGISKGWMKLAEGMGWLSSRILLSIIFFVVLTPLAVLRKLISKKDPLHRKSTRNLSLWKKVDQAESKMDFTQPW